MNDVFKALSDPTRREILLLVTEKTISVNDIADQFDMSRPAISRHLKVLRGAELIDMRADPKDARQINCTAQLEAMQEVSVYLDKLNQFWKAKLKGLGDYLDSTNT